MRRVRYRTSAPLRQTSSHLSRRETPTTRRQAVFKIFVRRESAGVQTSWEAFHYIKLAQRISSCAPQTPAPFVGRPYGRRNAATLKSATLDPSSIARSAFSTSEGFWVQLEPEQRQPDPTDHKQRSCRGGECYKGEGSFDYYVRAHILTLGYREPPTER
jgi:hypothetical protein